MTPTAEQQRQIDEERAKAQARFPVDWAKTLSMPGKKRRTRQKALREAAIEVEGCERVAALGGTCGNCAYLLKDVAGLHGFFCSLDSDFHGYVWTKLKDRCSRWSRAPESRS